MPPVRLLRHRDLRGKFGFVFAHTLPLFFHEKLLLCHGESSHSCSAEALSHIHIIANVFALLVSLGALLRDLLQDHFPLACKLLFILVLVYHIQTLQVLFILYQLRRVIALVIVAVILLWPFIIIFDNNVVVSIVLLFPKLVQALVQQLLMEIVEGCLRFEHIQHFQQCLPISNVDSNPVSVQFVPNLGAQLHQFKVTFRLEHFSDILLHGDVDTILVPSIVLGIQVFDFVLAHSHKRIPVLWVLLEVHVLLDVLFQIYQFVFFESLENPVRLGQFNVEIDTDIGVQILIVLVYPKVFGQYVNCFFPPLFYTDFGPYLSLVANEFVFFRLVIFKICKLLHTILFFTHLLHFKFFFLTTFSSLFQIFDFPLELFVAPLKVVAC
mmetsp:Transcript_16125/g.31516  ORF Transcript_16125/g.31516 Transcript_16125/m.31516 type:complete len:382 (+) Transcript_16125:531-1676(+)